MTEVDAAAWMLERLEKRKYLDQSLVAGHLRRENKELTYINKQGNVAIVPGVLAEFRKITPDHIVWSRGSRQWRHRKPFDKPGRMQA